jgi:hypothetical protein
MRYRARRNSTGLVAPCNASRSASAFIDTMRSIALIQRSSAFCLQEAGRVRLQADCRFSIDRFALKRSQTPKSYDRTQFSQVAGFSQLVVEAAIGTRNRNERQLATWTGLTRHRVLKKSQQHCGGVRRRVLRSAGAFADVEGRRVESRCDSSQTQR